MGDLILKSNKNFIRSFIAILFELGKYAFFKIAVESQINVHLGVRLVFLLFVFLCGIIKKKVTDLTGPCPTWTLARPAL